MLRVVQFTLYATLVSRVASVALPNYIKQCKRTDPNFDTCALESARASITRFSEGDKDWGLGPLDPLLVPEMIFYVPNENGLKIMFLDNYFSGLSKMHMENLKFDLKKKLITTDCLVNLDVVARYDLSGKLLMLPITSNGDATIKLKNTMLHIKIWYEDVTGPDGKTHWNIIKHDCKYEAEKATFRLENLLNDKNIADQINKLINEMWREIVNEVGPSIAKSLMSAVVKNVGILLDHVSFDEMMPAE